MATMKVDYKVISTDETGTKVLVEKKGFDLQLRTPEETFEQVKARFESDMSKVFRDGPHNTVEYCIAPSVTHAV
jgi:hypothetical protein